MKVNNNVVEFTKLKDLTKGQVFTVSDYDCDLDSGLFLYVDLQKNEDGYHYFLFDLEHNEMYEYL